MDEDWNAKSGKGCTTLWQTREAKANGDAYHAGPNDYRHFFEAMITNKISVTVTGLFPGEDLSELDYSQ